jgi:hypothetical protein
LRNPPVTSSLHLKLIKISARVERHARAITSQLAERAITGPMVRAILAAIRRLRAPPLCALLRSTRKLNETSSTGLPVALNNITVEPEHGGFAVRSSLFQQLPWPQAPLSTNNACPAVGFRRSSRQSQRQLGMSAKYCAFWLRRPADPWT